MSLQTDHSIFYFFMRQPICRGAQLSKALDEINHGIKSKNGIIGGFGGYPGACKRFASRNPGKSHEQAEPAAVIILNRPEAETLGLFPVEYTDAWLRSNEDVLDAIQTIDIFRKRPIEEKISTAIHFSNESEWMSRKKKIEIPDNTEMNVYIGPTNLKSLDIDTGFGSLSLDQFTKTMNTAGDKVEERIKKSLVKKSMKVNVFACHSTMNLHEEKESACVLERTFYTNE